MATDSNYRSLSDNIHYGAVPAPTVGQYYDLSDAPGIRRVSTNEGWQDYYTKDGINYAKVNSNRGVDANYAPIEGLTTVYNPTREAVGISGVLTKKDTRQFRTNKIRSTDNSDKMQNGIGNWGHYYVGNLSPVWQSQLAAAGIDITDGYIDLSKNNTRKQLRLIRELSRSNQNVTEAPVVSGNVNYYSGPGSSLYDNQSRLNAEQSARRTSIYQPMVASQPQPVQTSVQASTQTQNGLQNDLWQIENYDIDKYLNNIPKDYKTTYTDAKAFKDYMKSQFLMGDQSFANLFGNGSTVNDYLKYWNDNAGLSYGDDVLKGGFGPKAFKHFVDWLKGKIGYNVKNTEKGKFVFQYNNPVSNSSNSSNEPAYESNLLKEGGTINKYQQGGSMNEQQMQQAFMAYLADKYQTKDINGLIKQLMSTPGDTNETKLEDELQEFQTVLSQNVQSARKGARLYLKSLRGGCPEGYATVYYKAGGNITCSKCVKQIERGAKIPKKKKQFFKKK